MAVSLGGVTAAGIGLILAYSGITGKSALATLKNTITGGDPSTTPATLTVNQASGLSPDASPGGSVGSGGSSELIASFLAHGIPQHQIAGALGNIQVESSFSTTASGDNGTAIGYCQWEGNRRVNLRALAAKMGTTETDSATQIAFMWQELHGSELAAYTGWRATATATQAAYVWATLYERNAPGSDGTREAYARQWDTQLSGTLGTISVGKATQ